jgi:hypothetical protein
MGTTLTGTTPQDTYDSLIKVTDNGPISGTAKYLSDGLGNDSVLALSTSRVLVNHTNTPKGDLDIASSADAVPLVIRGRSSDGSAQTEFWSYNGATRYGVLGSTPSFSYFGSIANTSLYFLTNSIERMRITSDGNVGIGTSAPTNLLHLSGSSATPSLRLASVSEGFYWDIGRENATTGDFVFNNASGGGSSERVRILAGGGLTFNGDTAAANALDDYEEGTWTPSLGGNTTYSAQAATYTKIGRQVTVHFAVGVTTLGTGSGAVISGLPFTAGATNRGGGGLAYAENPSTAYASINPFVGVSQNDMAFVTSTTSGVYNNASTVFTDGTIISGTVTYFV